MSMETVRFIGDVGVTTSLVFLSIFAYLQTRLNRLMRKRIEQLEMMVYWQGQFHDGASRRDEGC